jgi:adenylate cyclase
VTIKKYTAPIADFARVEVEFDSIEEAEAFVPPEWFGDEITGHLEASDAGLLELSDL